MESTEFLWIQPQPRQRLRQRWEKLSKRVWNPKTRQFLGRSWISWAKITLAYFVFYTLLAVMVAVLWGMFYVIRDKDNPMRTGLQSMMKDNPGMGFRPMPHIYSTLVRFVQGKPSSYKLYTDHIEAFLDQYENEKQEGENFIDCTHLREEDRKVEKVCRFNIDQLGDRCQKQQDFGYDEGEPCVLLKLNKVHSWVPEPFANDTVPRSIANSNFSDTHIGITCHGENPADEENMGPIAFYPAQGFSYSYYPFLSQEGYRQPLVFVKFIRPKNGVVIQIWCKAWSSNISHHKADRAGSVHFELLVD